MEYMKCVKRNPFDKYEIRRILDYVGAKSKKHLILIKLMLRGFKINDILKLRVIDVKDKEKIRIEESKTKKIREIENLEEIKEYIKDKDKYECLFSSARDKYSSMRRASVIKVLKMYSVQMRAGDKDFIITPKRLYETFIYEMWKSSQDITFISKLLATSDLNIINSYIGVVKIEDIV